MTPTPIVQVIQIDPPILGPRGVVTSDGAEIATADLAYLTGVGGTSCEVVLMGFEFRDSFGKAFVGESNFPFRLLCVPCVCVERFK